MTQHNELDEALETLYHLRERHGPERSEAEAHGLAARPELLESMAQAGLITVEGSRVELTESGFARAEQVIRRHRLAERLLADVLHMSAAEVESGACEFEHMVAEEITESICILLGHPRTCPHGSPIPEGPCCRQHARETLSAAVPLIEAPVGAWARVAYINSTTDERQHRLTRFGVIPGELIKLHQLRPSVIVMLQSSRLAMEESVARDIFVWRRWEHDGERSGEREPSQDRKRSRLLFWRR